jgi:hypothetical protein
MTIRRPPSSSSFLTKKGTVLIVLCWGIVLGTVTKAHSVVSNVGIVNAAEWARSGLFESISEVNLPVEIDRCSMFSGPVDHSDSFTRKVSTGWYGVSRIYETFVVWLIHLNVRIFEVAREICPERHFLPATVDGDLGRWRLTGITHHYSYEIGPVEGAPFFNFWRRWRVTAFAMQFKGLSIHREICSELEFTRFNLSAQSFPQRAIGTVQLNPLPNSDPNEQPCGDGSKNGTEPVKCIDHVVKFMMDDARNDAGGFPYIRFWCGGATFALGFVLCVIDIGQRRPLALISARLVARVIQTEGTVSSA